MRPDVNNTLKNKKMNPECYKLRRMVIDELYQFKTFCKLPRITVRITEDNGTILGMARYESNIIWIAEKSLKMSRNELRHVIAHEIGHTCFNLRHDDSCPIMAPTLRKAASESQIETFLKYHSEKLFSS